MKRTTVTILAAITVLVALNGSAKAAIVPPPPITIATVRVGDVGNAAGSTTYGAVSYAYNIGKYEVTNSQYAAFLNAADAGGANANGIYNTNMGTNARGGITFTSSAASGAKYTVRTNMGDKPVNYVNYWDACRFANWLGNGQGSGSTETGAYTLTSAPPTNNTVTRNANATWAVASEDEWYKAAYYKGGSTTAGYWTYSTQSNTGPTVATANASGTISNPGANVANYASGADWNNLDGNVTTVGSAGAASYYGTFDQGGNVFEWNEAVIGSYRGLRGGSYGYGGDYLQAAARGIDREPTQEGNFYGFRVSQIPEPASMTLLVLGGIATLIRRRRRA